MTVAVIAVKDLRHAKTRLSSRFSPEQRRELTIAMVSDVLDSLSRVKALSGLLVVTPAPELATLAGRFGAEVLQDPHSAGYSCAVEIALRELERRRVKAMLAIPADVPSLTPGEITRVLDALGPPPSAVLVPSRDDRGTNAALLSPPGALPLRFGEPSFVPHLEQARKLGINTEVVRLPGLALDIDRPEDIDLFLSRPSSTRTYELLMETRRA